MPAFLHALSLAKKLVGGVRLSHTLRQEGASAAIMKYNKLGSSDLSVSEVCLGTMTFGEQNSEEESHAILDAAWSRGVNFLDTAEVYSVPNKEETAGRSEEIVGRWLQKQERSKVIVATKVAGYIAESWIPGNREQPRSSERASCRLDRASILKACDASLRRLQTDYIDLYQIHWPDRYVPIFGETFYDPSKERAGSVPIEETVSAMGELIKAGKIKHYGLSNETTFGVCSFVAAADKLAVPRPVSIQNSFSLVHRSFETELAEACAPSHYDVGLLPWFTLFKGFQARYASPAVRAAAAQYDDIAKEAGPEVLTGIDIQ
eukprot:jgi/Mesen1/4000/ME000211S03191